MANYAKEDFLDLQLLVNLLQTPNLSKENLDAVNALINAELKKIFVKKDPILNDESQRSGTEQ